LTILDKKKNKETLFFILLILAMFLWGASWVSGRYIAQVAAYESVVFYRFLLTSIFFIPLILLLKPKMKLKFKNITQVILGTILILLHANFFFKGLNFGLAGAGSIIFTVMAPLITFLLVSVLYRHKLKKNEIIGLLFGIIGGVVLLELWKFDINEIVQSGNIYFLLAACSWASITVVAGKSYQNLSPIGFSFYISLGGLIILLFLTPKEVIFGDFLYNEYFWYHIVFLSAFANVFASTIYFYASGVIGSSKASSYIYLVPVFAVILGVVLLDESVASNSIVGGIITIAALYLINKKSVTQEKTS